MTLKNLFLSFRVRYWLFKEERKVRNQFYEQERFRLVDQALKKAYFWKNPYTISKEFLINRKIDLIHSYGETPLTTLNQIAQECNLTSEDFVFELGGGRGRAAFFLHTYWGCQVQVFEWIEHFVTTAQTLAGQFQFNGIFFSHADYFSVDFSKATLIYLYGTCLSDEEIKQLIPSFLQTSPSVKIVTVSYSLQEYSDDFFVLKQFTGSYPWGEADIYINMRRSDE